MKKIIYSISVATITLLVGCSQDITDTEDLYHKNFDNYYSRPQDIEEAMGGVYNALYTAGPHSDEAIAANLLSDMMFGGGGPDDRSAKNVDSFQDPEEDTYKDLWVQTYYGVNRCNTIIETVPDADFSSYFNTEAEATEYKNQTLAEAHFMRGFFYFRAAKFFGGVPLILSINAPRDVPRSSYTDTYAQITADFKMAIDLFPSTPFTSTPTARYGHADKWVAEAYMARAYLYYTGYMTNIEGQAASDLPLPEGGSVSKSQVIAYLDDCINNSGYGLVDDFRNLWPYSYVNTSAGDVVLPWADTEGLAWAGQDGLSPTFGTGNEEFMFVQRYSTTNWDWGQQYNNRYPLFFGIRDNSMVPFGQGWGWGPVNPTLWNQWDDADPRKEGSILQLGDADQGTGGWQADKGDHETGLVNKKYTTIQHQDPDPEGEDGVKGMFYFLYDMNNGDPMQLWAAQDYVYLRFADVLLMHSEISETADGINAVRGRAGLTSVGYSLDALKEERLHEFAFEGLRWFDLVRWGDVDDAFGAQINVRNSGVDATYSVQYRPETKGLVPIPESEVRLSNGVYEQNPGW
ncbi:RagB/SusD family nutrient uptake outer membrane protein [Galbibacter pacificus]|uniref:RagB/SusD family nutrient uptake outer membrane protein n=1 Tax=Galbibacter pacificus TaxID=2996052 RepID=A0ABT6FUY2_9FLAO|nr:RagB/SusD family nutrient uptake outer membrane protein [Galbibacter pacificus]MDG3583452.1 RagB/SusD family nutrient uptake outer membrane protein [Galbibacter pacificus]MDG3587071.1 RagB/SusD family nutrient uptake outer membrane protein [Galbibacter pacificus]